VMYTDGIVEAMNAQKEEFGEGRLCELLWKNSALPCSSIIQTIQAAVHTHTAGFPIADDQTLVLLKRS
jgi:sigma-B regulation protein RsbU (phosphoserine phosphatase)